jgi:hypothetical protein
LKRMKPASTRITLVSLLTLTTIAPAFAGELSNLATLNRGQFTTLVEDFGAATAYKGVTPGNSLGTTGFDVGVEVSQSKIDRDVFSRAASNSSNPLVVRSSNVYVTKVHAYKGLPFGIDLGAFVGQVSQLNATLVGASARYQVIEDGLATPSLALRVAGTRMTGVSELGLNTVSVDAIVSKKLTFITPYAGVGSVRTSGSAKVGTLGEVKANQSRAFVGLNMNFGISNVAFEGERTGDRSSASAKIGFRF